MITFDSLVLSRAIYKEYQTIILAKEQGVCSGWGSEPLITLPRKEIGVHGEIQLPFASPDISKDKEPPHRLNTLEELQSPEQLSGAAKEPISQKAE